MGVENIRGQMTTTGQRHPWLVAGSGHSLNCSSNSIRWEIWRVFKGFLAVIEIYSLCLEVENVSVKVAGKGTGSPGEEF